MAEHERWIADEQQPGWPDTIEITMLFVRAHGGWVLSGSNNQGEVLFERNAWSVGVAPVRAEVARLMADNGYFPRSEWVPDVQPTNALNYTRGPLRRRFGIADG